MRVKRLVSGAATDNGRCYLTQQHYCLLSIFRAALSVRQSNAGAQHARAGHERDCHVSIMTYVVDESRDDQDKGNEDGPPRSSYFDLRATGKGN